MKNKILFLILFSSITTAYGQIRFDKGYLIDNENNKIECFIRNYEWEKCPSECEYKLTENGNIKKGDITSIKEFSIYGSSKYIRVNTKIDRSESELSEFRNPIWHQEQLFLKVLVQGKASLYNYEDENSSKFFYSVKDSLIQQLVYKKYLINGNQPTVNVSFRQQLLNNVNCANTTVSSIEHFDYCQGDLERYFKKYNECMGDSFIFYDRKKNRAKFNLRITPGINYSSFSMFTYSHSTTYRRIDFDGQTNFRLGLEAECILPFYKNKFGITLEPTYQYFNAQKVTESNVAEINYRSLELAVGIRYYLLLNEKTKIFIDGLINSFASSNLNSNVDLDHSTLKMNQKTNLALGGGIDYKRISVELRYYSFQRILDANYNWTSDYNKISFIIGYNLLKTGHNK